MENTSYQIKFRVHAAVAAPNLGVLPNTEFDRAKAFSKCTQSPLVETSAKISAINLKPFKKLIDGYLGFEMLSSAWIARRYCS